MKKGTVWRDIKNTTSTLSSFTTWLADQNDLTDMKSDQLFTADAFLVVLIPKFHSSIHGTEFWQIVATIEKLEWPNFSVKGSEPIHYSEKKKSMIVSIKRQNNSPLCLGHTGKWSCQALQKNRKSSNAPTTQVISTRLKWDHSRSTGSLLCYNHQGQSLDVTTGVLRTYLGGSPC